MDKKNIFKGIPTNLPEELFNTLAEAGNVKIERIVSKGQLSPPGFWYDQEQDEFIILLKGKAVLKFEGEESALEMNPGDFIDIPAQVKHRLEWTDPDTESVWLAVFYTGES